MMIEEDNEIDTANFFKRQASDLSSCCNLQSTLQRFGFSNDDKIDRRELVLIYSAVNKEMEKEIINLTNNNRYSNAEEMRNRLTSIRKEFDSLQTIVVKTNQKDQCGYLDKAIKEMNNTLQKTHQYETEKLYENLNYMEEEQNKINQIEIDNLELEISRIPRPSVKYSKRAIELFKAEKGLVRFNQYEDAGMYACICIYM